MIDLHQLLRLMIERDATDLHITAGSSPRLRINGKLIPIDAPVLSITDTRQMCYSILTDAQRHKFEEEEELDLSFGVKGLSRFRANIFVQRGAVVGVFRAIPFKILSFQELGLPPIVEALTKKPRGMILVTGPTGCGKSTTLASMIERVNTTRPQHIITIEDPIEYLHASKVGLVNQREVGADTHSFKNALKHILRQDPDIVLLGEMRDLETIEIALTVAETGHLCFATLHTNSSTQAINRVIDVFPPYQQTQVRTQLSFVLEAVLSQVLIPKKDGKGLVLALEIMIPNPAIRNLIREDKIHQIYSHIQVGQNKFGMQTLNQSLLSLYQRGMISLEDTMGRSTEIDELRQMLVNAGLMRGVRPR
ncbi:MAG: type IV pilus twitching motility protein PilT [Thermodesulfobacteriota bacterium]